MGRHMSNRVPNEPLREAMKESGLSYTGVCVRLGWFRPNRKADTTRLMRHLGISPSRRQNRKTGQVYISCVDTISLANARGICHALGVDFDEVYPDIPQNQIAGQCVECGNPMLWPVPERMCGFCLEEREMAA